MKSILYGIGIFLLILAFSLSGNIETNDNLLRLLFIAFSGIVFILLGYIAHQSEEIADLKKSIKELCESENI